jgi:hypothetical protein
MLIVFGHDALYRYVLAKRLSSLLFGYLLTGTWWQLNTANDRGLYRGARVQLISRWGRAK